MTGDAGLQLSRAKTRPELTQRKAYSSERNARRHKVVCDSGLLAQSGLVTCRKDFVVPESHFIQEREKKSHLSSPCQASSLLSSGLQMRPLILSPPAQRKCSSSALLLLWLEHCKNCLWSTVISFVLLLWDKPPFPLQKNNTAVVPATCFKVRSRRYLDWSKSVG